MNNVLDENGAISVPSLVLELLNAMRRFSGMKVTASVLKADIGSVAGLENSLDTVGIVVIMIMFRVSNLCRK